MGRGNECGHVRKTTPHSPSTQCKSLTTTTREYALQAVYDLACVKKVTKRWRWRILLEPIRMGSIFGGFQQTHRFLARKVAHFVAVGVDELRHALGVALAQVA